jgi:SAM-dependent methyltransferase
MARPIIDKNESDAGGPELPPSFDVAWYLAANPDLALAADAAADHYARIGRAEGRVASPLALRENLIGLIDDGRSVLEIGPFCDPLLSGPHVAYLDVLDAEQLRARAVKIGKDPARCPAWIDYVGGLEQVNRRFDAVISSHAIEHNPDLVHHLAQVERILAPDGLFCLIIPDKRYCFDHHIAESTIAQILQAHREQRHTHNLASVIEHIALTTHNNPPRHWAGDHGPAVPPDRVDRVRNAIVAFDANSASYIDVHAWYFTPDSFRLIVETLGALGFTGFEVAGVYDSARDRNEFCAVLRLAPEARERARKRAAGHDIIVLQTADADRYAPMLAITAPNVREYCRRYGFGYESFIGIKRGFHPWQATFNRIPMLVELVERGFVGWVLYLDADAWIQDLGFDLAAYLADKGDRAAIFAESGVTTDAWDVNAGVALINLGHPLGRALVEQWAAGFAAHSDDALRAGEIWFDHGNDQDLLHQILRRDEAIAEAVLIEQISFINGPYARFIRQQLRSLSPTFEARLDDISRAVADVFRADGKIVPARPSDEAERWSARLAHGNAAQPMLVEAAVPAPRVDLAASICATLTASGSGCDAAWAGFVAALGRRDAATVGAELAGLGRSPIGRGMLGGDRQHQRAQSRQFADRIARWTYDKLLSLAEAVGAVRLENPENGPWGDNPRIEPADLFASISRALDADLTPPEHIGGHLGIAAGNGIILHMRMLDAIHVAWRLRQLADSVGLGADARIAEIEAGSGLNAFYASRLGMRNYCLYDRPARSAVQAYMLKGAGFDLSLPCEPPKAMAIQDIRGFGAAPAGSIDLLVNSDSLPALEPAEAIAHLAEARRLGISYLLSINPETRLPDQTPVAELTRLAGGYRLAGRHRHWLRAGHVEELYRIELAVPGTK